MCHQSVAFQWLLHLACMTINANRFVCGHEMATSRNHGARSIRGFIEILEEIGAGEGDRTLDIHVGNVTLYR